MITYPIYLRTQICKVIVFQGELSKKSEKMWLFSAILKKLWKMSKKNSHSPNNQFIKNLIHTNVSLPQWQHFLWVRILILSQEKRWEFFLTRFFPENDQNRLCNKRRSIYKFNKRENFAFKWPNLESPMKYWSRNMSNDIIWRLFKNAISCHEM